ncbi:PLP-dependent aminotransferase family protein [Turicimonas muris]|uniref:MocR-like pyridoxine biosynthesis transcription factor PdxR n=1 Tax=Turicimonas muris TaxID=1796652 RepID=UPI0023F0EB94|nr:PLP-dependent aminotransferase family protein [Turicimonas muris]
MRASTVALNIDLNRFPELSAYKRISAQIQEYIETGIIREKEKLPSIRMLASTLKTSTDTVKSAYTDLLDQGFIQSVPRSGYIVSERLQIRTSDRSPSIFHQNRPCPLSAKARKAAQCLQSNYARKQKSRPFDCFVNEKGEFISPEWVKEAVRITKSTWNHNNYSDPFGYLPLRKIICDRLRQTRGIIAEPHQIIITSGTVQSVSLCTQILFNSGESFFLEDPSLPIFRKIFSFNGIQPIMIPVDENGANLDSGLKKDSSAGGILVTPSCQYPMSVCLNKKRREQMIEWARVTGSWIIEDDIDSLLTYEKNPTLPIRSMAGAEQCTIYLDSFSLLIYPGIRLGFMVVPEQLAESFAGAKLLMDRQCPEMTQAMLTSFLGSTSYESHLRKLITRFKKRKTFLEELLGQHMKNYGRTLKCNNGSHLSFLLEEQYIDSEISSLLDTKGVAATPISKFCDANPVNGFVLGFGTFKEGELERAVKMMTALLKESN